MLKINKRIVNKVNFKLVEKRCRWGEEKGGERKVRTKIILIDF
jgi:hypothetical protein